MNCVNELALIFVDFSLSCVCFGAVFRYATRWDLFVIMLGVIFTLCKALALTWIVIVYGEFTSLLAERMYGIGTSSGVDVYCMCRLYDCINGKMCWQFFFNLLFH